MLEKYFSAPKTLRRLRSGISGPHIDAFAGDLEREGYALASAVRYIRAAAHLGCFVQRRGGVLADIDFNTLHAFVGRKCLTLRGKQVSPHVLRHTCAMIVPPSLRKGKFRPPDKLLALLKVKP